MFEKLFNLPTAVREHQTAPLALEREEFLSYLHQRGVCRDSLRGFAALLKQIVRFLQLKKLRGVRESEIESAAREWFRHRRTTRGRSAGPHSEPHFKWFAKRWLRFHGRFIPSSRPSRPFALELREYEEFMKSERGYSQSTIAGRIYQTAMFLKWYSRCRKSLRNICLGDVDKYFGVKAKCWAKWSLASCAAVLRAFFRYAETRRWCEPGIANGIKSPQIRPDYFTPTGPKWDEVSRLLASTNGPNLAEVRAKAILVLLSIYGLRRSEIVRLMLCDFDWTNQVFTVRRAKRGRVQQFPIGPYAKDALLQYTRYARPECSCRHLFVTLHPPYAPMNPTSISMIVNQRMKRWRICATKKGPHSLRHACATRLLQQGASLQEIADFLGHRDSKSVGIYAKFDMKALCEVSTLDPCGEL
jgi:site-specific recombinase XerD